MVLSKNFLKHSRTQSVGKRSRCLGLEQTSCAGSHRLAPNNQLQQATGPAYFNSPDREIFHQDFL